MQMESTDLRQVAVASAGLTHRVSRAARGYRLFADGQWLGVGRNDQTPMRATLMISE